MGNSQIPSGPAIDAHGHVALDPTENVKLIVSSAVRRGDDLRNSESRHTREILKLHTQRSDDLRTAESRHLREISTLRANFYEELRDAEADRIDAIRAVDVGAVNRAAEVAATQASTLATQVAVSAETLRTQVQATAAAGVVGLTAALEPIQKDIQDLRKAQYEAQGQKTQVIETHAKGGNVGMWIGLGIAAVVGLSSFMLGAAGIVVTLLLTR